MKHIIIMLDYDDTLVGMKSEEWLGQNQWFTSLKNIKEECADAGIIAHFGIATLRSGFYVCKEKNLGTNFASSSQEQYFEIFKKIIFGDLGTLLENDLIFCLRTNYDGILSQTNLSQEEMANQIYALKANFALTKAKLIIENKFATSLDAHDVWLIDDQEKICQTTVLSGFNAKCVKELKDLDLPKQLATIKNLCDDIIENVLPLWIAQQIFDLYKMTSVTRDRIIDAKFKGRYKDFMNGVFTLAELKEKHTERDRLQAERRISFLSQAAVGFFRINSEPENTKDSLENGLIRKRL